MASQNTPQNIPFNTPLSPSFNVSGNPLDFYRGGWLEAWHLIHAQLKPDTQNSSNKRPRDEDGDWSTSSSQKRQHVSSSIYSTPTLAAQTTSQAVIPITTVQQTPSQPSSSTVLGKHARDSSCSSEQFLQSERVAKRQDLDMPGNPNTAMVLCPNPQPIAANGTNKAVAKPNPNMWLIMDDCMAASPNRSKEFEDLKGRYQSLFSPNLFSPYHYTWQ